MFTLKTKKRRGSVLGKLLVYFVLVVYLLVVSGKAFNLPVGLALVPADVNNWRRGDLLFLISTAIQPVLNESYVVACYPGYWNTACLSGIAIVNNHQNNSRTTYIKLLSVYGRNNLNNGYNNASELVRIYSIGPEFKVYSVVFRVPRELAVPLQLLVFFTVAYIAYQRVKSSFRRALGETHVLTPVFLLVFMFNMTIIGTTYIEQASVFYRVTGVSVNYEFNLTDSTIRALINTSGVYVVRDAQCYIQLNNNQRNNYSYNNNESILVLGTKLVDSIITARIPSELYVKLYESASGKYTLPIVPAYMSVLDTFVVKCRVRLNVGEFTFSVVAEVYWRDLEIEVVNNTLYIYNPNPVPLTARIVSVGHRGELTYNAEIVVDRLTRVQVDLAGIDCRRVIVQYTLLGITRSKVVDLD